LDVVLANVVPLFRFEEAKNRFEVKFKMVAGFWMGNAAMRVYILE
jgi:hypothetical protein